MHHSEMKVEMTRIRCRATNDHKLYITHLLCLFFQAKPTRKAESAALAAHHHLHTTAINYQTV